MKCSAIGVGISLLLGTPLATQAADMRVKAPIYQPATSFSWNGLYVGAVAGYAWGTSQHVVPLTTLGPLAGVTASDPFDVRGALFGATLGYNYQRGNWVFGIEGDYSLSNKSGVHGSSISLLNPLFTVSTAEESLITVRGRVGYAFNRFLAYGTAGWASARVKAEDFSAFSIASDTQTMTGWVAGGGVEYAFLQNWSAKAEYLYVDLGSKVFLDPNTNLGGVPHIVTLNNHIVRVGVNYRFSF